MIFGSSRMIPSAFTLLLAALITVTTKADWGCYIFGDNACNCEAEYCSESKCDDAAGSWSGGCSSCSCICEADVTEFTVKVDLYAGKLGYYTVDECLDVGPNPTLKMKIGEIYTFDQTDISNYYHPMGFAYGTDGALSGEPELEPGYNPTETSSCAADLVCPAPIYFKDGERLEAYTNLDDSAIEGSEFFGLDAYEPEFFYPIADWASADYSVKLRFNDETFTDDFFYFCHIHKGMSGRIVLADADGTLLNAEREPPYVTGYLDIEDATDDFDVDCGTYDLVSYRPVETNQDECPETFVCGQEDGVVGEYAQCIDAMNCAMNKAMTTTATDSPSELFLIQMIPHHENAVQMARALLKKADYACTDYEEETQDCILEGIARSIITNQNYQIQVMLGLYESVQAIGYENAGVDCLVALRDVTDYPTTLSEITITGIDSTSSPTGDGIIEETPCFSALTTAFVSGKGSVTMDLIEVGDSVLTGSGEFQPVYSIDHRDINKSTKFLQIMFGNDHNVLEVTPKHMIFMEGHVNPVASGTVDVGDRIATPNGYETVTDVGLVERKGVFNPLTADGTIVVSGMIASTFSSLLHEKESIEISGVSIMSYQQFFTNLVKPYKFFCTTLSLELCRANSEKVMVSEIASRVFFFHSNDGTVYQTSLLSFVAFLLSIMETIVLPLLYISIPVGIVKILSAGKK